MKKLVVLSNKIIFKIEIKIFKEIKHLMRLKLVYQKYLQLKSKNRKQVFKIKITTLIKFCYFKIIIVAKTSNKKVIHYLLVTIESSHKLYKTMVKWCNSILISTQNGTKLILNQMNFC